MAWAQSPTTTQSASGRSSRRSWLESGGRTRSASPKATVTGTSRPMRVAPVEPLGAGRPVAGADRRGPAATRRAAAANWAAVARSGWATFLRRPSWRTRPIRASQRDERVDDGEQVVDEDRPPARAGSSLPSRQSPAGANAAMLAAGHPVAGPRAAISRTTQPPSDRPTRWAGPSMPPSHELRGATQAATPFGPRLVRREVDRRPGRGRAGRPRLAAVRRARRAGRRLSRVRCWRRAEPVGRGRGPSRVSSGAPA